jgi:AraC family transcriptional regulator of adaptative response/methylated-DNA-[protein]-cysteine methyltransferase
MPAVRTIETPMCPMTAAATDRGVCLLEFGPPERLLRERAELEALLGEPFRDADHPLLGQLESELTAYFAGTLTRFTVPLDTPGTDWQRRVWDALCRIPFGEKTSYGRLAERLGSPGGSRAVGLANGQNRVAIVVPCHRVIAADGTLHGYAGGLDRKCWLLDHEALHAGRGLFSSPA